MFHNFQRIDTWFQKLESLAAAEGADSMADIPVPDSIDWGTHAVKVVRQSSVQGDETVLKNGDFYQFFQAIRRYSHFTDGEVLTVSFATNKLRAVFGGVVVSPV